MSTKKKVKRIMRCLKEPIINGIVFAVLASLISTFIIVAYNDCKNTKEQLKNVSNIYIGCNKQWADEKFGVPQFTGKKDGYTLCAYVTDFFVVQMVYDDALSAQAYSITVLNNDENANLEINDKTLSNEVSYVLGEFSYYDFPKSPEYVFGSISNGNARACYYEKYYLTGLGNYYNYYIGFLDYGKMKGTLQDNIYNFKMVDGDVDDEVTTEKNRGVQIIADRRNCYPNTYAVSNVGDDIAGVLFSYGWFNSLQLRNSMSIK